VECAAWIAFSVFSSANSLFGASMAQSLFAFVADCLILIVLVLGMFERQHTFRTISDNAEAAIPHF
jgi:hypothetical protein